MPGRRRLRRWIVGTLTLGAIRVSGALPFSVATALGRLFGRLAYYVVPRIRRVGLANLDLAYGDALSDAEKKRVLKRAAEHFGVVGAQFAQLPKFQDYGGGPPFRVEGAEHVDLERGGLLISAHLGNWEYMGVATRPYGFRGAGVVRPFSDARVNAAVDAIRLAGGFDTLPKDAAGPQIMKLLREGRFVVTLIDQSARENGVPTTFFGERCWSTVAPAMIALRSKAPIYPFFAIANDEGGYTVQVHPRIEFERTGDLRKDLVAITQQCQDVVEAAVREHPEQWLWFHRRWKARPRLEAEWAAKEARAAERTKP